MNKTVDSSIVKLTNYRSVWGYIHKNKQATIPQISKDIGLSLPTVTRAVDYGVAEGIIEPDGVIGAERGRKAQVYKLHADYMHFLLIYLDADVLSYRIHDFRSRTIGSGNMPVNDKNVLSALEKIIECNAASDPLLSIVSIAVSGVVCDGVVKDSAAFPSLGGMDLSKNINRKFGMTALVDNDLHAASNVARIFSDYKNDVNVLFAFGKRKSGAGIIVNGDVLCGAAGAAGAAAAAAGFGASGFERILPIRIVRKMMQVRPTNVTPIPMITTNALETCIGGYAPFMYSGAIIARRICISTVWKPS